MPEDHSAQDSGRLNKRREAWRNANQDTRVRSSGVFEARWAGIRSGKYYAGCIVDGKKHDVHRIVAEETLGRKLRKNEVVHHLNGDINDNTPTNLQVMTRSKHSRMHRLGNGLSNETRKKLSEALMGHVNSSCRKLDRETIQQILSLREEGATIKAIAERYGVARTTIFNIVHGNSYKNW